MHYIIISKTNLQDCTTVLFSYIVRMHVNCYLVMLTMCGFTLCKHLHFAFVKEIVVISFSFIKVYIHEILLCTAHFLIHIGQGSKKHFCTVPLNKHNYDLATSSSAVHDWRISLHSWVSIYGVRHSHHIAYIQTTSNLCSWPIVECWTEVSLLFAYSYCWLTMYS